jgi:glycosyltransferase involved in cell wall biosynthesis
MNKTKISILVANYNGEKYLLKCVNSCLRQKTNFNYEVIIIDDNSNDKSLEILKKFQNKIKILKTKKKTNYSIFNTYYQLNTYYCGLKKAKGEIICFLDSDDFMIKNKLSEIEFFFSKNKKTNFLFDQPIVIDSKGEVRDKKYKYGFRFNKWPKFPPQSCISVSKKTLIGNSKKLFQKKFPLTTLDFRIAALADMNREQSFFLDKKLTFYFQHNLNETNKNFKKFNLNWFKRRLEAYQYYQIINKKKIRTFDYYFSFLINKVFGLIYFYKNKKN